MFRNLVLGVWPPQFMQYWNQNFIQDNYYKLDLIYRSQVSLFNFSILNVGGVYGGDTGIKATKKFYKITK